MANLLTNGNFADPPNPPTLLIGTASVGSCAAPPPWETWNNTAPPGECAYMSTAIVRLAGVNRAAVTPKDPQAHCFGIHDFLKHAPDTAQVMEVCTNSERNGIAQVFQGNPQHTLSSVWVFVLRGQVGVGTGHGGTTGLDRLSKTTYQWEHIQNVPNDGSPATEFIVYSASAGGAWFFVANAVVEPV